MLNYDWYLPVEVKYVVLNITNMLNYETIFKNHIKKVKESLNKELLWIDAHYEILHHIDGMDYCRTLIRGYKKI